MITDLENTKRIMGLDLGSKRVGVAVSDSLGITAQGVCVIPRSDGSSWLKQLDQLIKDYQIASIVIGLPRNMDGSLGEKSEESKRWAKFIEETYRLPVYLWDERLSTVAVERTLIDANVTRNKRKKVIDQLAATWILQGFLDAKRREQLD